MKAETRLFQLFRLYKQDSLLRLHSPSSATHVHLLPMPRGWLVVARCHLNRDGKGNPCRAEMGLVLTTVTASVAGSPQGPVHFERGDCDVPLAGLIITF